MFRAHTLFAVLAGAAIALTALPVHGDHALAAKAAKGPALGSYYLALGDSLSVGYQADPAVPWTHGWVFQFRDKLAGMHPIELQDLAVRGECSDTLISGGLAADCPTKVVKTPSQLQEAVAFLADHPGLVNPITVDIGANNLGGNKTLFLNSTPAQQKAILGHIFPQLGHDWGVIFGTLRAACPSCNIIAVNQYNPFPAGALKVDVSPVFTTYSTLLTQVAGQFKVRVADVYTPFVGNQLTYTSIAHGDDHATTAGYTVMAQAVAKVSGYAVQ